VTSLEIVDLQIDSRPETLRERNFNRHFPKLLESVRKSIAIDLGSCLIWAILRTIGFANDRAIINRSHCLLTFPPNNSYAASAIGWGSSERRCKIILYLP
jgi:hypothetical protein